MFDIHIFLTILRVKGTREEKKEKKRMVSKKIAFEKKPYKQVRVSYGDKTPTNLSA